MCFCKPEIRTPYCNSIECQKELDRIKKECEAEPKDRVVNLKAKLRLMWEWAGIVNKATGIEPPKEFFNWFDDNGKPL